MKISILAAAATVAIAGSMASMQATAADLDFAPPPPMPIVYDWSGFYVGGHVGWGEANFDGVSDTSDLPDTEFVHFLDDLDPNGLVAGVQGGFNWQVSSFVFGIEGDISFTDWDDSEAKGDDVMSVDVDFLGSVRGKAGFAFDRIMIYGTGGIAFTDATFRFVDDVGDEIDENSGSVDFDDIGFVVGAGGDWAVTDNISVGAVALWYIFDEEHDTSDLTDDSDEGDFAELEDAFVIRANVNFHF